jgi:hypothetical protein
MQPDVYRFERRAQLLPGSLNNQEVVMKRAFRLIPKLTLIAVATACSAVTQPDKSTLKPAFTKIPDCNGPATSLSPAIAASLPPRTGNMMPDDKWADLAAQVPGGFAGLLYVDSKPVLMLTDPSQSAAAKQALAPSFPTFNVNAAEVRQARWDFAQLVNWYDYLLTRTQIWQTEGITTGDKDEAINRIRYGVVDVAARDRLVHALGGIELPCDLIAIEITGKISIVEGH